MSQFKKNTSSKHHQSFCVDRKSCQWYFKWQLLKNLQNCLMHVSILSYVVVCKATTQIVTLFFFIWECKYNRSKLNSEIKLSLQRRVCLAPFPIYQTSSTLSDCLTAHYYYCTYYLRLVITFQDPSSQPTFVSTVLTIEPTKPGLQ